MGYPEGHPVWWADFRTHMPENWQTDATGTEFHRAVMAWLESLGLQPDRLGAAAAIVPWQGAYELHVDEVVSDANGYDRTDPLDADALLTIRRILPVSEDSWPARPEAKVPVRWA